MEKKDLVLVLDDEQDLLDMIEFQFKAKGFLVETATNGVEGLAKLETIKPQLIILDLNMPQMGGIEFYQRICTDNGRPAYPVLILTARANMEQMFKDFDVDGFMAKPFDIGDLIHEAESIIKKHTRLKPETRKGPAGLKTVYIADNDPVALKDISAALLEAGYRVAVAKSGAAAIEMVSLDPPTLALVKLALPDISGDIVVLRMTRLAKAAGVRYVLYEPRNEQHLRPVRQQIGEKSGVMELVEYNNPADLVNAVDSAIQKGEIKAEEESAA